MWTIVLNQFACFYCTTFVFLAVHRADLFKHLALTTIINTENIACSMLLNFDKDSVLRSFFLEYLVIKEVCYLH